MNENGTIYDRKTNGLEIAVIGMAGRFPGAADIEEYWRNLIDRVESITFYSRQELEEAGNASKVVSGEDYVKAESVLEGIEYFDAGFFGYTPKEANIMDPQVRIFHESAWAALEEAGYDPARYEGSIGVYAGASPSFNWEALSVMTSQSTGQEGFSALHLYDKDFMSTRISHKLDLKGPSFTMYTACSTSLAAIHLASQAILNGECDMALAGGVTVIHLKRSGYQYQEGMVQSPDGHCRAFDARAAGMAGGDGVGLVVLKRLEYALSDRDHIYAVIKGSALNNDGTRKVGYAAPSVYGQAEVIQAAQQMAETEPESIGYIEAHGTGTALGDPVEIEALTMAFATKKRNFCAIGTVKSNVGHLDSAAGVAGFIKAVLALYYEQIPPSLHVEQPNPRIDFANTPFYINTRLLEWHRTANPRRAGVSSFGIGGTNAHIILEEYPAALCQGRGGVSPLGQSQHGVSPSGPSRQNHLILLSAKTQDALDRMTQNLAEYFKKNLSNPGNPGNPANPGPNLADVAYTLQVGRGVFPYKRMLVCTDGEGARAALAAPGTGKTWDYYSTKESGRAVVFMFSGQGSQYVNMGRELYRDEPVFRREMDRCCDILEPYLQTRITGILYPGKENKPGPGEDKLEDKLNDMLYSGPIKFSIEYALARQLKEWGIQPYAMTGHSLGEYTAACLSGVFTLEDAIKLVAARGKLLAGLAPGAMMSVTLSEEQLKPWLEGHPGVNLAAVNAPSLCIVSGPPQAVAEMQTQLEASGCETLRLNVQRAGHSHMMDPILKEFAETAARIPLKAPQIPFISGVTGNWIRKEEATDPRYWSRHLREPVRFFQGLTTVLKEPGSIFVQVGADRGLPLFVSRHPGITPGNITINLLPHPKEEVPDVEYLYTQIGRLWLAGVPIDWEGIHRGQERNRVSLPTYPFERQRYPVDKSPFDILKEMSGGQILSGRKPDLADWFYIPGWQSAPLPPGPGREKEKKGNHWLVFMDEEGIGARLAGELRQEEERVIEVAKGTGYAAPRDSETQYVINPGAPGDYDTLLDHLAERGDHPEKIVHLWNVTGQKFLRGAYQDFLKKSPPVDILETGIYSLVNLAQALGRKGVTRPLQLNVVTDNMQEVTGEERLCPEKATILGPVKVIPLEYLNIVSRSIDIPPVPPGTYEEERLIRQLLAEIQQEEREPVIAYRGNYRWQPVYKPVRLEAIPGGRMVLRPGGVYLVTGGLGGIGLVLAGELAKTAQAKLVLTGRSGLIPREEWEKWMAEHPAEDTVSRQIGKVRELEEMGAEVMIARADTADLSAMQAVVRQAEQRFGTINGVIHCAGLPDGAVIQRRTREMTEEILAPKVQGTLVLDRIISEMKIPLDFFVLCSSGNAILPVVGQVGHGGASAFLDAFAYYRNAREKSRAYTTTSGTPKPANVTISINWNAWIEVGRAAEAAIRLTGSTEVLQEEGILSGEGVEIFNRILENPYPQAVISTKDFQAKVRSFNSGKAAGGPFEDQKKTDTPAKLTPPLQQRPALRVEYTPPTTPLEQTLSETWKKLFGYEKLGVHDNFFELGGDSLKAIGLIANIHKDLEIRIPLTEVFRAPTIAEMAEYIQTEQKEKFVTIEPVEEKEVYELSSAQKRLYFLYQMDPESINYNMPTVYPLGGAMQRDKLEAALRKLVARHENLRTSFKKVGEQPVQRVHKEKDVSVTIEYYEADRTQTREIIDRFVRPFDLTKAPLIRSGIIKLPDQNYAWIIDMHHIVADGISETILAKDLKALYQEEELKPLRLQYKDFSQWQGELFKTGKTKKQEDYWLKLYGDEIPKLDILTDYPRPFIQGTEGDRWEFILRGEEAQRIKEFGRENDTTLFINILTVLNILLYKYTGQSDIIIGCDISGRRHVDLQEIVGMFVNMLAIRNHPEGAKTVLEFLNEVKSSSLKAFENQDMQFEELVERLNLERDPSRNPLFDIELSVENFEGVTTVFEKSKGKGIPVPGAPGPGAVEEERRNPGIDYKMKTSLFDISFDVVEKVEEISFPVRYSTRLYKEGTIRSMARHMENIMREILANPRKRIAEIEMLSPAEREQLLEGFNETGREIPGYNDGYYWLFAGQVEKTPDAAAVIDGFMQVSYKKLAEEANYWAGSLYHQNTFLASGGQGDSFRENRPPGLPAKAFDYVQTSPGNGGILRGTLVGVRMERSVELVAVILGILKAGGVYVPLEPTWPEDRVKTIIEDGEIGIVITPDSSSPSHHSSFIIHHSPSQTPVYMIYTSGTTGKPKGVMIHQGGMLNHLNAKIEALGLTSGDIIAQTAPVGFDISIWQMLAGLLVGASVAVIPAEIQLEPAAFWQELRRKGVTILESVPSLISVLLETHVQDQEQEPGLQPLELDQLRWMIPTGERLTVELAGKWNKRYPRIPLLNAYGPTEASDDITHYKVKEIPLGEQASIPIGKPLPNLRIYILDRDLSLCPVGVKGEICVAGVGVGPGYLNSPELTAANFSPVINRSHRSYRSYRSYNSKKIYRTGDIGYWQEDGNIQCLGRLDHQVKIRGNRIELGEIENHLAAHGKVKEAAVLVKNNKSGEKFLCAYVVGEGVGSGQLTEYLSGRLPAYMVPSYFVVLEKFPLTPSGKLDRRALPELGIGQEVEGSYSPPRNPLEEKLVGLWAGVLGIDINAGAAPLGIDDNFFTRGGHSLRATVLTAQIHKELKVKVPLAEIFRTPTIRGMAEFIKTRARDQFLSIEPEEKKEYYPLSSAQLRLYILDRMDRAGIAYNMPQVLRWEGAWEKEKLEGIFRQLIRRHESLRTSFHLKGNQPVQRIHDEVEFEIEYDQSMVKGPLSLINCQGRGEVSSPISVEKIIGNFIHPFDLSRAPLLRVGIIEEEEHSILLVDMHHIIGDGVSEDILVSDFKALYEKKELDPLRLQYKDFSQWQNREKQRGTLEQQQEFWKKQLQGEVPVLNLPSDYPRPVVRSFEGAVLGYELGKEGADALKRLAREAGATVYMVILALYNVLLGKIAQQEDIIIGTPVAGRRHADLEQIMGMFVNTLVLRNYPRGEETFTRLIETVKERALEAFENQDYPFEELVGQVFAGRDTSRNPLFDAMLVQETTAAGNQPGKGPGKEFQVQPYEYDTQQARFDLTLYVTETPGPMHFTFEYSTRLFRQETIRRYVRYFNAIAENVGTNPGQKLAEIDILPEEEKRQLLIDFNRTGTAYPRDKTIPQLFLEQVERKPDSAAVIGMIPGHGQGVLTYRQLDETADGLVDWLKGSVPASGAIVAIMVEHSVAMIAGVLAILKAGHAYLPVNPHYPEERVNYLLSDSGAKVLLSEKQLYKSFCGGPGGGFFKKSPLAAGGLTSTLAYIMYTSGTTGTPKGSLVTHRSVVRLVKNTNYIDFREEDRVLQGAALEFDASTFEIWGALLNGLQLYPAGREVMLSAVKLKEMLTRHKITTLWLTAALFNQLSEAGPGMFTGLRNLLVGGDVLSPLHIARVRAANPTLKLINGYGPTENTTFSTTHLIEKDYTRSIPIGKPIANSTVYILDRGSRLVPLGSSGELCVGGDGLSLGYLNSPELTAEKFDQDYYQKFLGVQNPFFKKGSGRRRLYRTGDLARWQPEGSDGTYGTGLIEFLGRMDQQVKIRGYRVEVEEIENRLLRHVRVKEAVVIPLENKDQAGEKALCAYVTLGEVIPQWETELRQYLTLHLPDYMIPVYFMKLEKIPLTANGKVDRRELPAPRQEKDTRPIAPRGKKEKIIAAVWQEILRREEVGIDDNFFATGGNSLDIVRLSSRLNQVLGKEIDVLTLFEYPTIRSFSDYMRREEAGAKPSQAKTLGAKPQPEKENRGLPPDKNKLQQRKMKVRR